MRIALAALLAAATAACSTSDDFTPDPTTDSGLPAPPATFPGRYEVATGCTLTVDKAAARASCSGAGIQADLTIAADKVTIVKLAITSTETATQCWTKRVCTVSYQGGAMRVRRVPDSQDGRFASAAGKWEGRTTATTTCTTEQPAPGAPTWCASTKGDTVYDFDITATKAEATIKWLANTGGQGQFKALETKGGVRVADKFYRRSDLLKP